MGSSILEEIALFVGHILYYWLLSRTKYAQPVLDSLDSNSCVLTSQRVLDAELAMFSYISCGPNLDEVFHIRLSNSLQSASILAEILMVGLQSSVKSGVIQLRLKLGA